MSRAGYSPLRTEVPEGILVSVLLRPAAAGAVEPEAETETEAEEIGQNPLPSEPAGASACVRFWVVCDAKPARLSGVWGGFAKSEFFTLRRARFVPLGTSPSTVGTGLWLSGVPWLAALRRFRSSGEWTSRDGKW